MNTITDFEELTVASLFALSPENSTELAVGIEGDPFDAIVKEAKSLRSPVEWSSIRTDIAGAMTSALQAKVISGWASAWQKCAEVKEKAEESRNSPEVPVFCTLLKHSIESTLHPYVEVLLDQKLIQKIDFDVSLNTEIDGLILNMQNASIVSIQTGRCEWSGSIALQGVELIHRDIAELDLPGRIVLKHPISLLAHSESTIERS